MSFDFGSKWNEDAPIVDRVDEETQLVLSPNPLTTNDSQVFRSNEFRQNLSNRLLAKNRDEAERIDELRSNPISMLNCRYRLMNVKCTYTNESDPPKRKTKFSFILVTRNSSKWVFWSYNEVSDR